MSEKFRDSILLVPIAITAAIAATVAVVWLVLLRRGVVGGILAAAGAGIVVALAGGLS